MYFKDNILKVSAKFEESSVTDGGAAYIIHYTIFNESSQKIDIKILKTGLIHKNIIKDRDYYLTGFLLDDFELFSNTGREGADIYLKSNVEFNLNDRFFIQFADITNSKEYIIFFEKNNYEGFLSYAFDEIKENNMLNPKKLEYKLMDSIERLTAIEEKLGLDIQNLSINVDGNYIEILGDIFIDDFSEHSSISLNATFYDKENKILQTERTTFYQEDFLGFETFDMMWFGYEKIGEIEKIRLYPSV